MRGYRRVWSRRSLATLAIAQISAGLTFYVPVSALFLTGRGLDYGQIFILESVLVGSIAVLEIPSSILADRIGRRPLIVVGYVFNALAQCFFAFGHDYAAFAFSFSLSGAGIALLSGAEESYVYEALGDSAEEVSTGVFGHFNALGIVAGVVASVVGGLLAEGAFSGHRSQRRLQLWSRL